MANPPSTPPHQMQTEPIPITPIKETHRHVKGQGKKSFSSIEEAFSQMTLSNQVIKTPPRMSTQTVYTLSQPPNQKKLYFEAKQERQKQRKRILLIIQSIQRRANEVYKQLNSDDHPNLSLSLTINQQYNLITPVANNHK